MRIPKTINDRQKELLKEFEAEFEEAEEGKGDKKKEDDSCASSAWQRLKDFMKK